MAFVFASTSAIDRLFEQRAKRLQNASANGQNAQADPAPIRRPYRGIQIKEDTYATMSIVDGSGKVIPLVSESDTKFDLEDKGRVDVYADFVLQQITEERTEKQQIIETFGDSFIFFFGERPRMLNISGILVNTDDFGWRAQFMHNYENFLRGTKLVQRNARMYLAWDTIVVEGYPINVQASEDAGNPYTVNFNMQIFLTNHQDFGRIGIKDFPAAPRDTETFSALNRELEERDRFISTTTDVRRLNFESRDAGGGLGGFFREGVRAVNNITNLVGNLVGSAATILSGRVVRKPLGIAGFLSQVNQGNVIVGGLGLSATVFNNIQNESDVKLVIPSRPRFAEVSGILRTQISQNVDEYPLLEGTDIPTTWSGLERLAFENRKNARLLKQTEQMAVLVAAAQIAQGEAEVLDTIQDLVQFTRTGFALFNTVRAVAVGGPEVALDAIGLGGVF